jgi:hypothetical protein
VRAIIVVGQELSLDVTAEGVETAEQVEFLKTHGCGRRKASSSRARCRRTSCARCLHRGACPASRRPVRARGMARDLTDERAFFLSTLPAGRRDRWLAAATLGVSAAVFLAAARLPRCRSRRSTRSFPTYQSAVVINDLITAGLLFGQYSILQSRGLLALATAYLFTAFIAVAHTLSFPGCSRHRPARRADRRAPRGCTCSGTEDFRFSSRSTHSRSQGEHAAGSGARPLRRHLAGSALTLARRGRPTLLATAGHAILPEIMQGSRYTSAMIGVVSTVWATTLIALFFLWRRRPHTVLDLWLIVVICVWGLDVALSAVLNAGRFDLGFYVGRTYGLLASGFVLLVLLIEANALYARLVEAHEKRMRRSTSCAASIARSPPRKRPTRSPPRSSSRCASFWTCRARSSTSSTSPPARWSGSPRPVAAHSHGTRRALSRSADGRHRRAAARRGAGDRHALAAARTRGRLRCSSPAFTSTWRFR